MLHHILYHAHCADGFAAATIASLVQDDWPKTFQPVNYSWPQQLPQSFAPGDKVTYLDYTPPQDAIDHILARTDDLTILDHHSTAAVRHGISGPARPPTPPRSEPLPFTVGPLETLSESPRLPFTSVFDLQQSGAQLAWQHFFPGQPQPRAIALIGWRDLGHAFQQPDHPDSAPALNLHAYLMRCIPRTFEAWRPLLLADTMLHADAIGERLRLADRSIIAAAVNGPYWLDFHGAKIPAVHGLEVGLISDACQALLKAYPSAPFAASWYIDGATGHAVYSLRSRKDGPNVAEIAAAMAPGGGGHPNAAGFHTPIPIPFV